MRTAEKLVSLDPDHIDGAYYAWKAAEAQGDKAQAGKWLQRLNEMSPRIVASARPANPDDAADWEASVTLAKQFMANREGGLYAKALGEKDAAKRIGILDQLINEASLATRKGAKEAEPKLQELENNIAVIEKYVTLK